MLREVIAIIQDELKDTSFATLAVALIPDLDCATPLSLGSRAWLIPPLKSGDGEFEHQVSEIRDCFKKSGFLPPMTVITRSRVHSLLIAWDDTRKSESQVFRAPLAMLNLCVDTFRPIVIGETIFGQKESGGVNEVDMLFHERGVDAGLQIVPAGPRRNYNSLQDYLAVQQSRWTAADRVDNSFRLGVDLLLSGDSKAGIAHQDRTRLVEYMIALESLLLDQEAELALRFALRFSVLLGARSERSESFELGRRLYRLRSIAVHAGARQLTLSPEDATAARNAFRQCALRYFNLIYAGMTRSQIISLLDSALLSISKSAELESLLRDVETWPADAVGRGEV